MIFREIIAIYCENHTKPINTLCRQIAEKNAKAVGTYASNSQTAPKTETAP
jgi:hypothetical protein